ncbi:MAG: hypothetical protein AAF902_04040 [Chloroflexota bacterium]
MLRDTQIRLLKTETLFDHCVEQTENFKKNKVSDSRFCYELLRRAAYGLPNAWALVYEKYSPSVLNKIKRYSHSYGTGQLDEADFEDLAQNAIVAWHKYVLNPECWKKFQSLEKALAYLDQCTRGAVKDCVRSQKLNITLNQLTEDKLAKKSGDQDTKAEINQYSQDFDDQIRQIINRHCQRIEDKIVFQYIFEFDLKPKDVSKEFPTLFESPARVSSTKRNLLKRIERDPLAKLLWHDWTAG